MVAIAAGSNVALAAEQAVQFHPEVVSVGTQEGHANCASGSMVLARPAGHASAWPSPEILLGRGRVEQGFFGP